MIANDIVYAARECIGTPFKHQGRLVGKALDCAGLVVHVAQRIGADYIDLSGYGRNPSGGILQQTLDSNDWIELQSNPQYGDILLMRFSGEPQHLAICAGGTIIHSYANVKQVCEHRFSDVWRKRVVAVYRYKGLT